MVNKTSARRNMLNFTCKDTRRGVFGSSSACHYGMLRGEMDSVFYPDEEVARLYLGEPRLERYLFEVNGNYGQALKLYRWGARAGSSSPYVLGSNGDRAKECTKYCTKSAYKYNHAHSRMDWIRCQWIPLSCGKKGNGEGYALQQYAETTHGQRSIQSTQTCLL